MSLQVRPLLESDLEAASALNRLAFRTFLGLPERMLGDADFVRPRFRHTESVGFVVEAEGQLLGVTQAARRGSAAILGPITVRPNLWSRGVGRALMEPLLATFAEQWHTTRATLFTFAQSPLHGHFFQRHGFWPGHLVAVMQRQLQATGDAPRRGPVWLSQVPEAQRGELLAAALRLTDALQPGLDVTREARGVVEGRLGEVVLLTEGSRVEALALCHVGPGTEAGSGAASIRFAAVAPGPSAAATFAELLEACERLALQRGVGRLVAGVNTGRREAYRALLTRGYRSQLQGVWMQRPDGADDAASHAWVLEDAR